MKVRLDHHPHYWGKQSSHVLNHQPARIPAPPTGWLKAQENNGMKHPSTGAGFRWPIHSRIQISAFLVMSWRYPLVMLTVCKLEAMAHEKFVDLSLKMVIFQFANRKR